MDIKLKRSLLALFFPNRCPVCGVIIGSMERFCINCTGKLTPYTGTSRPPHTKSFTACFVYDENIRPAIMLLKRGVCGNADYALGMYLAEKLRENGISDRIDLLIPVPMSRSGKAERGFNQSELICKVVGRELGIPTAKGAAAKIRSTLPQKSLGRMSRRVNVRNAFSVRKPEVIAGKRVLIIDDICTTGSTISELAKVLSSSGAPEVHAASCCRTQAGRKNNASL